ncbi:MAG: amidohydrolase family protein [Acidimicrobiia bacterium]
MAAFNPNRQVFDAHLHLGTWGTRELDGAPVTPLAAAAGDGYAVGTEHDTWRDCLAYLDAYGIGRGIVMANYLAMDPGYSLLELNRRALEAPRRSDRLHAALFVSPIAVEWVYTREALGWAGEAGVKAIKFTSTHWAPFTVNPATWDRVVYRNMEEILAVARERGVPLQFHTGHLNSMPEEFDGFLAAFGSELAVHLVHSGETVYPGIQFVSRFPRWLEAGYDVYCDTSMCPGFVLPWLLRELAATPQALERILFATDAPWGSFPSEYWKVEALDVSEAVKDGIFWDNAHRLYEPGSAG